MVPVVGELTVVHGRGRPARARAPDRRRTGPPTADAGAHPRGARPSRRRACGQARGARGPPRAAARGVRAGPRRRRPTRRRRASDPEPAPPRRRPRAGRARAAAGGARGAAPEPARVEPEDGGAREAARRSRPRATRQPEPAPSSRTTDPSGPRTRPNRRPNGSASPSRRVARSRAAPPRRSRRRPRRAGGEPPPAPAARGSGRPAAARRPTGARRPLAPARSPRSSRSALLGGALWFINATFQPFHGDRHGRRRASPIPTGADAGQIGKLLERAGRHRLDAASSRSTPRSRCAAATCAPARYTAAQGHDATARRSRRSCRARRPGSSRRSTVTIPEGRSRRENARRRAARRRRGRLPEGARAAARVLRRARKLGAPQGHEDARGLPVPGDLQLTAGATRQRPRRQAARRVRARTSRKVDMSYAKRKNLTRYDVLIIASMIEREAQLAARAPAGRRGHLQPPQAGHAARDRRDDPLRDEQLDAPAARVRARARTARTTRACNRGLPPTPIGNPGLASIKAAAQPGQQGATCSTCASPASPASTRSPPPTRSSSATSQRYQASRGTRPVTRLGVCGWPVAHSRSPAMHNAALAARRPATTGATSSCRCRRELFAETVRALPAAGFRGVNVTIPHKEAALALADDGDRDRARDRRREHADVRADGAHPRRQHRRARAARARSPRSRPRGRSALVLGAGGAARAAVWALRRPARPTCASGTARRSARGRSRRSSARARSSARSRPRSSSTARPSGSRTPRPRSRRCPCRPMNLGAGTLRGGHGLPGRRHRSSSKHARRRGASVVDGLEILVAQGAASFERWTGTDGSRAGDAGGRRRRSPHEPHHTDRGSTRPSQDGQRRHHAVAARRLRPRAHATSSSTSASSIARTMDEAIETRHRARLGRRARAASQTARSARTSSRARSPSASASTTSTSRVYRVDPDAAKLVTPAAVKPLPGRAGLVRRRPHAAGRDGRPGQRARRSTTSRS